LIIKQISAAKSKVIKYLDEIEKRLITEVESVQKKNEEKINRKKPSLKVKQTHKIYGYPRDKLYSIKHHVDYRNNQSGRLCVFHSLS
jgi:hypothetical protein